MDYNLFQKTKHIACLLLLLCGMLLRAQLIQHKTWLSAVDKGLKGPVRSWTMRNDTGVVRHIEYDANGKTISDTYKGTVQDYVSPEALPWVIKKEGETVYDDQSIHAGKQSGGIYNARKQLAEQHTHNELLSSDVENTFDREGRLLSRRTTQSLQQTRAWNSPQHEKPTYSYTETTKSVAFYGYNEAGMLAEFQYYNSDIFRNVRIVYHYDASNHLTEQLRYDSYNIPSLSHYKDNYFDAISSASIDKVYPGFWSQGEPVKETWAYNNKGSKVKYIVYGYLHGPSFKATWDYDGANRLIKETHHDPYHDVISAVILFDEKGNVVKETDMDYWAKEEYHFYYDIVYAN